MKTHDKLYSSIGMPPQYRIFFDLMNLPPLGWEEIRRVLAEYAVIQIRNERNKIGS